MSAEHIRRRLVVRLGGKPEAVYIDKIGKVLLQFEQSKKIQIDIITRSKKKADTLEFSLANGEAYELSNYIDPLRDKPKKPDYKPPEIRIDKLEKVIVDEPDDAPFTIMNFILWAVFMGLVALSGMATWLILRRFS
jgi:hypothetical protein